MNVDEGTECLSPIVARDAGRRAGHPPLGRLLEAGLPVAPASSAPGRTGFRAPLRSRGTVGRLIGQSRVVRLAEPVRRDLLGARRRPSPGASSSFRTADVSSLTRSGAPGPAAPHCSALSRSACRWRTSPRVSRSHGRRRAVDTPDVMTPARPPAVRHAK